MMAKVKQEQIESAETATALIRNLVIIIGGIVSVVAFVSNALKGNVEARLEGFNIAGSKFLIADRDKLSAAFAKANSTSPPKPNVLLPELLAGIGQAGRLDAVGRVTIRNDSKKPVHLLVKIKNVKYVELDPVDVAKGPFMRTQFLLVDVFSECPLQDQPLSIGDGGFIWPDSTGTLELKEFPVGCGISLQLAHARANDIVVSVFSDGTLLQLETPYKIYGPVGHYADNVSRNPPWGLLFLVVAPLVLIVLVALGLVRLLARLSKGAPPTVSEPTQPPPDGESA